MNGKEEKRRTVTEKNAKEQAAKKKLAEMNLLDDFLFSTMVAYPEIGEKYRG